MFRLKHIIMILMIAVVTDVSSTVYGLAFEPLVYHVGQTTNTFNEMNPYINSLYPHYGWLSPIILAPYEFGMMLLITLGFYYLYKRMKHTSIALAIAGLIAIMPLFAGSLNYVSIISAMI